MCGIAGKIFFGGQRIDSTYEIPHIQKTLEKLHHRGPDDQGFIIDRNVWLGATRLSIIDLSPSGHQPMKNEDGSLTLVFNGEIYNHKELKKNLERKHRFTSQTDSEVILHLYEEHGADCLKFLRGMFAFAVWDKRKQELFLARDRIGKKPIKYFYNDNFFIFASELKAFINHPDVPKEIDYEAVDEFLAYQYVPSPKTGFKNIWKLPPAHYMIVKSNGNISIVRYWNLDYTMKDDIAEDDWVGIIQNKLQEAIKLRLQSDVPLGIHLSGGIDSGIVTALAALSSKNKITTFSIGFENTDYDELPFARIIAKKYHSDHHEIRVKQDSLDLLPKLFYQYEEPFADPSILPTWNLMKESRKFVTVALNGDGGDENFAGYRRYQAMKLFRLLKYIPGKNTIHTLLLVLYRFTKIRDVASLARLCTHPFSDYKAYYQDLIRFISTSALDTLYTENFKQIVTKSRSKDYLIKIFGSADTLDIFDQLMSIDIETFLPEVLLAKADMASMAHSIEVRSPFLDHQLMELIARIPSNLKLKNGQSKYILTKLARKYLPRECFMRRKQGFLPPLEYWFRGEYYRYLHNHLTDKRFLSTNIVKLQSVHKLLDDHYNYRANNTYILWSILCLKHWLSVWFNL